MTKIPRAIAELLVATGGPDGPGGPPADVEPKAPEVEPGFDDLDPVADEEPGADVLDLDPRDGLDVDWLEGLEGDEQAAASSTRTTSTTKSADRGRRDRRGKGAGFVTDYSTVRSPSFEPLLMDIIYPEVGAIKRHRCIPDFCVSSNNQKLPTTRQDSVSPRSESVDAVPTQSRMRATAAKLTTEFAWRPRM